MRYKNWTETVNGEEVHIFLVPTGWESGFAHALTLAGHEGREWFFLGRPGWVVGHEPGMEYRVRLLLMEVVPPDAA